MIEFPYTMKHTLEHHKLKKTDSREAVLSVLGKSLKPMSVEDIFALVKKDKAFLRGDNSKLKAKKPDLVTVYRTLETFKLADIVREVVFKDRITRYELIDEHGGHCHHAVCDSCGLTEHIDDPAVEKALSVLSKKFKHIKKVDDHILEFFGVCDKCSKV